jgi:hypothetical protein
MQTAERRLLRDERKNANEVLGPRSRLRFLLFAG